MGVERNWISHGASAAVWQRHHPRTNGWNTDAHGCHGHASRRRLYAAHAASTDESTADAPADDGDAVDAPDAAADAAAADDATAADAPTDDGDAAHAADAAAADAAAADGWHAANGRDGHAADGRWHADDACRPRGLIAC